MPSKTSAPVRVLPGGLTAEKQDAINALVKSRVDELPEAARAAAAITLWSSLKSKFGCTYKAIPPDLFGEALSLVSRVFLKQEPYLLASLILFHGGQDGLKGRRFLIAFNDGGNG